ncbi:trypsin-like peptidase domain-containing protein [Polaromonas sp. Pch-P]|uniref:trypsin-like peptidase domain-containing protein n=2 Tax=unclassified Polaromonas TaxID=2638319 RepID=UPI000F07D736|nr:trypsin-like peptidase domain-containing protein [Polaromonas sp. Pch-P]AYQ27746.1 serine protease [Polaromonas sp. SP1]
MPFTVSKPSTQALHIQMRFGETVLSEGTAFVVMGGDKPFLITNRHNVTGLNNDTRECLSATAGIPDNLRITHNFKGHYGTFFSTVEPLFDDETPRWVEYPGSEGKVDVVALPLTELEHVQLYPFEVSPNIHTRIRCADFVHVVGFPFGVRTAISMAIWATGFVASEPEISHGGEPVFLIDCRTRPGQSGSPVVTKPNDDRFFGVRDAEYELLGIYSGRINKDSDIGKVWKAYVIAELVHYAYMLSIE